MRSILVEASSRISYASINVLDTRKPDMFILE